MNKETDEVDAWFDAKVISVNKKKRTYKIRYDSYGAEFDEHLSFDRVRKRADGDWNATQVIILFYFIKKKKERKKRKKERSKHSVINSNFIFIYFLVLLNFDQCRSKKLKQECLFNIAKGSFGTMLLFCENWLTQTLLECMNVSLFLFFSFYFPFLFLVLY